MSELIIIWQWLPTRCFGYAWWLCKKL